jgi:hypothetical protein
LTSETLCAVISNFTGIGASLNNKLIFDPSASFVANLSEVLRRCCELRTPFLFQSKNTVPLLKQFLVVPERARAAMQDHLNAALLRYQGSVERKEAYA